MKTITSEELRIRPGINLKDVHNNGTHLVVTSREVLMGVIIPVEHYEKAFGVLPKPESDQ